MSLITVDHPVFELRLEDFYEATKAVLLNDSINIETFDFSYKFIRIHGRNFGLHGLYTLKNGLLVSLQEKVFTAEYKRKILDSVIMIEGEMVRMYGLLKMDD